LVNSLERSYAEALRQFTTGRVGWSSLCIFISPLMEGTEGFIFMYFHCMSFGIKVLLCFTVFLTLVWKVFVRSVVTVWKFILLINQLDAQKFVL